jgi:hypothetical protein
MSDGSRLDPTFRPYSESRQVEHDLIDMMTRGFLLIVLAEFDNRYALRPVQEWHRVLYSPPRLACVLPSDDDMVGSERFN